MQHSVTMDISSQAGPGSKVDLDNVSSARFYAKVNPHREASRAQPGVWR